MKNLVKAGPNRLAHLPPQHEGRVKTISPTRQFYVGSASLESTYIFALLKPVSFLILRVFFSDELGKVDNDLGLFPGRIILHFAVKHHDARAIRHGFEDALGEDHFIQTR